MRKNTYLFNTIQRLLIYTPTEVGTPGLCPKVSEFKTIVINMTIIAFARVRFIIITTYQENYIKTFWRQFHENGISIFTTDKEIVKCDKILKKRFHFNDYLIAILLLATDSKVQIKLKTWAKRDVKIYVVLLVLRIILFKKYIHL